MALAGIGRGLMLHLELLNSLAITTIDIYSVRRTHPWLPLNAIPTTHDVYQDAEELVRNLNLASGTRPQIN